MSPQKAPSEIITLYKNRQAWIITMATALPIFILFYIIMSRLPGNDNESCSIGASLTWGNIGFSAIISLLVGIMMVGFNQLKQKSKSPQKNILTGSSLGIGGILASLTIFCTLCTIPVLSIFGVAISLSFLTTYNTLFKLLSLLFFSAGLWMLDEKLRKDCTRCKP